MGYPYSLDLRERIINAIDNGATQVEAAKIFKVNRRTISRWLELRLETNSLAHKIGYQKGHSHKITDWDEFEKFAEANKYCTGEEMASKWATLKNIEISVDVIYLALAKIEYTFKKKPFAMQKASWKSSKIF
jgi:transposase